MFHSHSLNSIEIFLKETNDTQNELERILSNFTSFTNLSKELFVLTFQNKYLDHFSNLLKDFYLNTKPVVICPQCANLKTLPVCFFNHQDIHEVTNVFEKLLVLLYSMYKKENDLNNLIGIKSTLHREVVANNTYLITKVFQLFITSTLEKFKQDFIINLDLNTKLIFLMKEIGVLGLFEELLEDYIKNEFEMKTMECNVIHDKQILQHIIYLFENFYYKWCILNVPSLKDHKQFSEKIVSFIKRKFMECKTKQFFDIIKHYPDSLATLFDIQISLTYYSQSEFVTSITDQLSKRLLTPGVATPLIIETYIRIIKIMKVIEPELYLFELLSSPIKDYLKQRKDTMRWIVTTILSEEDQNLKDDLGKQYIKSYNNKDNNYDYLSSDEDLESAEKWEPQKFSESKLIIRNKNADIISTLVNIFGSPEKFMEQYKRMLAERCVSEDNFLLENEIKNLLLLKRKFGETLLHGCDIIIKDFKDSLRINNLIQKTSHVQDEFNLKCLIINKNFWPFKDTSLFDIKECEEDNTSPIGGKPILRTEKFDSHLNKLDTKFEKYKKEYMKHKFSRTLDFYTNLGYVDLTLQFENCEVKFRVTPLAAVLIKLFDEDLIPDESTQRKLDLDALSEKLKCNPNTLKKKLNFWVNSGVLTEMTNSYSTEEGSNYYVPNKIYKNLAGVSKIITEEDIFLFEYIAENENPMNLENAIVSIIRNSGPKNFEQIYKTLCFSYQITISEIKLRDLLGKMILDQKIFKEGEHYKFIIQST